MSLYKDRLIESTLHKLARGDAVCTADGEQIGTVAEIAHDAIKVEAPLHPSFWIAGDYVVRSDPGRADLSFERKDLGAYRMDAPEKKAADPLVEQQSDHIIGDREQIQTRIRMERELAGQREALPHMHPRGHEGAPDTFGTIGEPVESELERLEHGPCGEPDTKATGGIANVAWLWFAGAALGVAGAMAWRRRRRARRAAA